MSDTITEKKDVDHVEHAPSSHSTAVGERGFVAEGDELPKGYYFSPFFLGTTCAIGFNLMVHHDICPSCPWLTILGFNRRICPCSARTGSDIGCSGSNGEHHLAIACLHSGPGCRSYARRPLVRYLRSPIFLHHWYSNWLHWSHCWKHGENCSNSYRWSSPHWTVGFDWIL